MIRYQPLPASVYKTRRLALAQALPVGSLVIALSAEVFPANADANHTYIPNSNFFYLTGLDQPGSIFWGFKTEQGWQETLFIPACTPHTKLWEGEKYSTQQAQERSGCQDVRWVSAWTECLRQSVPAAQRVYINLPTHSVPLPTASERLAQEIRGTFQRSVESLAPVLQAFRARKDVEEIKAIRKAIDITRVAFEATVPKIPTLDFEYQIEAELTYHFIRQGAQGHAFEPIVAGGKNACTLHYTTNHARLQPGELVLLDFGANWGHYKADITRVVPISGKFSPRQIAVYETVLSVLDQSRQHLRPGITLNYWKEQAQKSMMEALVALGMISSDTQDPVAQTKKWFPHSIGHHLGLDVHDPCPSDLLIQPGMVLTCEPGLYLPEESLGIRLETDLYVSDDGIVDLGDTIPMDWREIEYLTKNLT